MKLNLAILGMAVLSLSACKKERLEGNVSVKQNLTIYGKKGVVEVPKGDYMMQILPSGTNAMIKFFNFQGQELRRAEVTGMARLAGVQGQQRVYLKAKDIGQVFDVDYTIAAKDVKGSTYSTSQSCSLGSSTSYREVCEDTRSSCSWNNDTEIDFSSAVVTRRGGRGNGPGPRGHDDRPNHSSGFGGGFHRPDHDAFGSNSGSDFGSGSLSSRPSDCGSNTFYRSCSQEPYTTTDYGSRAVTGYDVTRKEIGTLKMVRGSTVLAQMVREKVVSKNFVATKSGTCR